MATNSFSISTRAFKKAVRISAKAIRYDKDAPLLANVIIHFHADGNVTLNTFSEKLALKVKLGVITTGKQTTCSVAHKALTEVLTPFSNNGVLTVIYSQYGGITLRDSDTVRILPVRHENEYVDLAELDAVETVLKANWKDTLAKIAPFAYRETGKSGVRYILRSVFLEPEGRDTIQVVAADGSRMGIYKLKMDEVIYDDPKSTLLEIDGLRKLLPIMADNDTSMLLIGTHRACFRANTGGRDPLSFAGAVMLVDGNYPNWHEIVPKTSRATHLVEFDISNMAESVGFTNRKPDNTKIVVVHIQEDHLEIFHADDDAEISPINMPDVPCELKRGNPGLKFSFRQGLMQSALKKGKRGKLYIRDKQSWYSVPILLDIDDTFHFIVMPLRLPS